MSYCSEHPECWGRKYSPRNTRLLRDMIRRGRIVVDTENGVVLWPNGKQVHTRPNFWGYPRFQVRVKRDGRRVANWFFVHKAVMLSEGLRLKRNYEINHIDHDPSNCKRSNLEYIHYKLNMQKKRPLREDDAAF